MYEQFVGRVHNLLLISLLTSTTDIKSKNAEYRIR